MTDPVPMSDAVARARAAWLRRGPEPEPVERDEAAMREARRASFDRVWRATIPPRFVPARVTDADESIRDDLIEWCENPNGMLVLLGPVGTGKTHLAVACAGRVAWKLQCTVEFTSAIAMFDALRPDGLATVDSYVAPGVLVLDDLGTEKPSAWTGERLYAVLDRRWQYVLPTILTSNLDAVSLADALGPRLFSRVTGSDAVVLTLVGKDRRRK